MLPIFLKGLDAQVNREMSTDNFLRCEIELKDAYCTVSYKYSGEYSFVICPVYPSGVLGAGEMYRGTCHINTLQSVFLQKLGDFLLGVKQKSSFSQMNLPDYIIQKTQVSYMNRLKGRGVFANLSIPKGSVIEVCPVLVVSPAESAYLMITVEGGLVDYVYPWVFPRKAIPLGNGVLYNCNRAEPELEDIPGVNALAKLFPKKKQVVVLATEDIYFGQEILIDYWNMEGDESLDSDALWQEVRDNEELESFKDPYTELFSSLISKAQ